MKTQPLIDYLSENGPKNLRGDMVKWEGGQSIVVIPDTPVSEVTDMHPRDCLDINDIKSSVVLALRNEWFDAQLVGGEIFTGLTDRPTSQIELLEAIQRRVNLIGFDIKISNIGNAAHVKISPAL